MSEKQGILEDLKSVRARINSERGRISVVGRPLTEPEKALDVPMNTRGTLLVARRRALTAL